MASVIVPVYNVAAYLEECVESIRGQTYTNLQIILVDDGSTDESGRMCDALAKEDPRIQVIHKENGGLSSARNAGLDISKGVYIYFVDSDDWVERTMVEETLTLMERGGYDQCVWGMNVVEEGKPSYYWGRGKPLLLRFREPEERKRFLCRWFLSYRLGWTVWSRVYRRDVIEQHGLRFQNEREIGAEDLDFTFRYLAFCESLYYIPKAFYAYRQRNGSIMQTNSVEIRMVRCLHMIRRQERILSGLELFQPFYFYSGVVLAGFMDNFTREQSVRQGLVQARALFQDTEEWDYLAGQARLAARDRSGLRRTCGWYLGGRVFAFFQFILDGNPEPLRRRIWVRRRYEGLRDVKTLLNRR